MTVAIVDLGCANLASVAFALDRLGARYVVTRDPAVLGEAERAILPGVGSALYAAERLDALALRAPLQAFERPLLGVCLGMQLLFERSEEGGASGLGRLSGDIVRLDAAAGAPWPHMGWSRLLRASGQSLLLDGVEDGAYAYFVHGYGAPPHAAATAVAVYGAPFSAIVEDANVFGCQFHPERSGETGARILRNFLEAPC